jgi:hypothetical protein
MSVERFEMRREGRQKERKKEKGKIFYVREGSPIMATKEGGWNRFAMLERFFERRRLMGEIDGG